MLKFLKDHLKKIVMLAFAYVYVLFVAVTPIDYAVTAPGGLTSMNTAFVIEGHEMPEEFYTIFVYSYRPITRFQYYLFKNDPKMIVSKMTPAQHQNTIIDEFRKGQISKFYSYQTALIHAYQMASEKDDSVFIDYGFEGLSIYSYPRRLTEITYGDVVIEIDGKSYEDYEPEAFFNLSEHQNVRYKIKKASGEIYEVTYEQIANDLPFGFFEKYEIYDAFPHFETPGLSSLTGGPSGGMLQTLSIYASLLNINIGDKKITGTGTVNYNGNVGRIGGIVQKIYTAEWANADIFFIPISHYPEIMDIKVSFEIIPVFTIEEAADWLYENFY